ncbi:MOB kinase activator-like 1A [Senna tora]|uniref:MOB kinase activator-like 1A n=1 Tax=Senna tora TaxID=362788 RepID=A0A834X4R5_9FABA|nr:MOB kinase activator-like 1A [Senna tora]
MSLFGLGSSCSKMIWGFDCGTVIDFLIFLIILSSYSLSEIESVLMLLAGIMNFRVDIGCLISCFNLMILLFGSNVNLPLGNQKTFRPKKSAPSGSKGAQLQKHIDATLGSGNLREAVKLPPGEDINEWLAVNTVDFFNQVNILYGTLTEFCTANNCPTMTAGPKYEYRWADGVTIKKPIEVSAPKYVEYLMDWIESQLDDETIFPQKLGAPFPHNFGEVVKTIFKRLFRVYAHIYHSHFQKIVSLKEEAHLNTCFKHFVLFTWEFRLIDKAELAPLQDLVESIVQL